MTVNVGPLVPRRGNGFSRWLGRLTLRMIGWKLVGEVPNEPKMVMLGAPHTTNFDGVLAIATLISLGLDAKTMIKDSAFKGLLGKFLLWAGAVPINRKSPKGVVEQSVDALTSRPKMLLLLAPEGTRSAALEWKRGFYHIALAAKVPILTAACNYQTKLISFSPALMPSGDYAVDLARILQFVHENSYPRHPERLSKPLCELRGRKWQAVPEDD